MRVAIEAGMMCRNCKYCSSGRYNLCRTLSFRSSAKTFPHADGTLQSHLNHPVSLLHPITEEMSYSLAAIAEPLSVILHATRRARVFDESVHSPSKPVRPTIAIFGAGTIGLLAAALSKTSLYPIQAARILLFDINPTRLAYASEHGFVEPQDTYLLPLPKRELVASWSTEQKLDNARENITSALRQFNLEDGVDCVYECTGAEPCIQMGIFVSTSLFSSSIDGTPCTKPIPFLKAAKPGGRVLTIGMGTTSMTIPLLTAATREVDLLGVFRYANTYPEAIGLMSNCPETKYKLEKLITHRCVVLHDVVI